MRVTFDPEADALYLRLDESPIAESEESYPGVVPGFNEHNDLVAIELLQVRAKLPGADLTTFEFSVA